MKTIIAQRSPTTLEPPVTASKIHHLDCGTLHAPPHPRACCHCLAIVSAGRVTLVDTGIGLADVAEPERRIGQPTIEAAGFQFHAHSTAARQIERLGYSTDQVTDIVLTHCDPDHAGGLSDFPDATVHISAEEHQALASGNPRYCSCQFEHGPKWRTYGPASDPQPAEKWFGIEARRVDANCDTDVLLVPLFGHTLGHCGVAVRDGNLWQLHVGDAYYLRVELETDEHPVSQLADLRAEDLVARVESLAKLRRLQREHAGDVRMFGYHDVVEFDVN